MVQYEIMYIINTSVEDQARKELIERFNTLITSNGGTVDSIEEWGKRRMAYTIDYMNEGFYVLERFTASPEFPKEFERNLQISEQIVRYLITRVEAK